MWRAAVVWLSLTVLAPVAKAQEANANSWVGKRVITRFETVLRIGNQIVDERTELTHRGEQKVFRVYTVEMVNGNWLWLVTGNEKSISGIKGWVPSDQVILFEKAIEYFTAEIRSNPSSSYGYGCRAVIRQYRNELDLALADYNEALRIDPTDGGSWLGRAHVHKAKSEPEKAIADYTEAIRLEPDYSLPYYQRANLWADMREYAKAIADYDQGIRLKPSANAYAWRGNFWAALSRYDKAIADFDQSIRLDPADDNAYFNRGLARSNTKDYDKAITDFGEAIRIDPNDSRYYVQRAKAWSATSHCDNAIADYSTLVRLKPTNAYAYNQRALLWASCPHKDHRDGKKAVESATKACALTEWQNTKAISTLAAAYAEFGDFVAAVKWQEQANKKSTDPEERKLGDERLNLYKAKRPSREPERSM
jgi:tetratricopeptide (TPR) repeat protein